MDQRNCSACNLIIEESDSVKCMDCKNILHYFCIANEDANIKKLSKEKKKKLRCLVCADQLKIGENESLRYNTTVKLDTL